VALGAQHVEAAGLLDLLGLGRDLGAHRLDGLVPGRLVLLAGVDRVEPAPAQLQVGQELVVAAQHDVGAAAGHVGGHGDRAGVAGLAMIAASRSWCLALSTSCGTCSCTSSFDRYSDFSTLVVPTSTGWPRRCFSAMSSATAANLAASVL
jgi:hypothetical protein